MNPTLHFYFDRLVVSGAEHKLESLDPVSGHVFEIIIPREAMGFGDVKFIAAIGAFLGWKSVFFTIASASVIGALVGTTILLLNKRHLSSKIPFGTVSGSGCLNLAVRRAGDHTLVSVSSPPTAECDLTCGWDQAQGLIKNLLLALGLRGFRIPPIAVGVVHRGGNLYETHLDLIKVLMETGIKYVVDSCVIQICTQSARKPFCLIGKMRQIASGQRVQ